jgi:hypothetical protein
MAQQGSALQTGPPLLSFTRRESSASGWWGAVSSVYPMWGTERRIQVAWLRANVRLGPACRSTSERRQMPARLAHRQAVRSAAGSAHQSRHSAVPATKQPRTGASRRAAMRGRSPQQARHQTVAYQTQRQGDDGHQQQARAPSLVRAPVWSGEPPGPTREAEYAMPPLQHVLLPLQPPSPAAPRYDRSASPRHRVACQRL